MSAFTYRSDREADFKCLEDWLAAGMFGPLNEAISYEGTRDPDVLERLHKYVARKGNLVDIGGWKEIYQTTLPTRFDSPLQYTILSGLISRITKVCERIGIDVSDFPHSATIPTGLVQARAVSRPCSKRPFLLFDSQH